MTTKLGLDEALISVRRSSFWGALEVFYQIDECFGCPLDYLKVLYSKASNSTDLNNATAATHDDSSFVIGTKHDFRLELRDRETQAFCRLDNLSLDNHGHYQINVAVPNDQSTSSASLQCTMSTIEKGDCYLCPIAILLCILFAITAIEKVYRRFGPRLMGRATAAPETAAPGAQRARNIDNPNFHASGQKSAAKAAGRNKSDASVATGTEQVVVDVEHDNVEQREATSGSKPPASTSATAAVEATEDDVASESAAGSGGPEHQPTQQSTTTSQPEDDHRSSAVHQTKRKRVESLDTFRGLTIAGMIFVNYGGAGYVFLDHKPWNGMTAADFVFPFFIFSMGASIALSTRSQVKQNLSIRGMSVKILRRTIILMALGLCLNSKWLSDEQNLNHLRITGVLQRFSISYLVIALMYAFEVSLSKWFHAQSLTRVPLLPVMVCGLLETLTAVYYLTVYVWVTFYLNYDPNCPVGYTGPGGKTENGMYANCTGGAAAWLDHLVLGDKHLYQDHELRQIFKTTKSHDPEGILGYTTSIVLTLIGLQCGKLLIASSASGGGKHHKIKLMKLIQWFTILLAASLCAIAIPVNKRLWSMSFIMVTGASAYFVMLLLYVLVDVYHIQREIFLIRLLNSAGKNALFLYVGHSLLSNMLPWHFVVDQSSHLQLLLRLAWATFAWLLAAHYMALKGLYIRI